MDPFLEYHRSQTRRQFFGQTGLRLGGVALASMMGEQFASGASNLVQPAMPGLPHFAPKAKRIIYLFMSGAPSHLDLFDPKQKLKIKKADNYHWTYVPYTGSMRMILKGDESFTKILVPIMKSQFGSENVQIEIDNGHVNKKGVVAD